MSRILFDGESELALDSQSDDESSNAGEAQNFAKAINDFAFKLYNVGKKSAENVLVSPTNMAICLIIAWSGSEGSTAEELAETLELPSMDPSQASSGMAKVIDSLLDAKNMNIYLLNKVYTNKGIQVKKPIRKLCAKYLRAEAEEVEFTIPDSARKTINQWVEKKTKGWYKEYLSPYTIAQDTNLLFVSATLFKAGWFRSFSETETKTGDFKTACGKSVQVDMLNGIFQLKYHIIDLLNAKGITLTYWDESFQLILLLPNAAEGFYKMEEKLPNIDIRDLTFSLRAVNVTVPKFRIEKSQRMKDTLTQIGATEIFQEIAELSNVANESVFVHDIFHTMFFGVTEHGSCEDVKGGESQELKVQSEPVRFKATRPFMFIVKKDAAILFVGRVMNPLVIN